MIAEILNVEFVKILELVPGDAELLLRAGSRLEAGPGRQRPCVDRPRHRRLVSRWPRGSPVVVENLATETRFESAPLLHEHGVVSGHFRPDRRPRRSRLWRARRAYDDAAENSANTTSRSSPRSRT